MKTYAFALHHHTLTDRDYVEIKATDKENAREQAWQSFELGAGDRGYSLVCLTA